MTETVFPHKGGNHEPCYKQYSLSMAAVNNSLTQTIYMTAANELINNIVSRLVWKPVHIHPVSLTGNAWSCLKCICDKFFALFDGLCNSVKTPGLPAQIYKKSREICRHVRHKCWKWLVIHCVFLLIDKPFSNN